VVELGRAYLHFDYVWISAEAMESSASRAFDIAEEAAGEFLRFFAPVDVEVVIVEGSGKLTAKFRSVGSKAIVGLVMYGGLRTAVDYAGKDIRRAASYVIEQFSEREALSPQAVRRARRDAVFPRKVRRVLEAVERGQLTADDGTKAILDLAEGAEGMPPEAIQQLREAIHSLPVRRLPSKRALPQVEIPSLLPTLIVEPEELEGEATRVPPERPGPPPRRVVVVREPYTNEKRIRRG
jgi:hypothetical protein